MRVVLACAALALALHSPGARAATAEPTFTVPADQLAAAPVFIAYGDMRFTDPAETGASNPVVRRALVARVAAEHPAAVLLNGDIPWHGRAEDYAVYAAETRAWRDAGLRVYPALGNHEFAGCSEPECLALWWQTFPQLTERRWYSVALGSRVLAIALDSDASLLPGSEQRAWLETQVSGMSSRVRLVVIFLHHPPVADAQDGALANHNARPNEVSLAEWLGAIAPDSRAKFIVSAGHTHNYERFLQDGVVYLVSGGGGAHPYPVDRGPQDLYGSTDFPNYHYVRLELRGDRVLARMIRLGDPDAAVPSKWETRDRFEIRLRP